jgi:hypothetical protein
LPAGVKHELALVRHGVSAIAQMLASLGFAAPAYLLVSLHRRGLHYLTVSHPPIGEYGKPTATGPPADILSPPVYIGDFNVPAAELVTPALDPLWNSVGIDHTQTSFNGGQP